MKRFLFVVPPLTGHVNPTIAIAHELEAHGHRVVWAAHPTRVRPLLPEGAELVALDDRVSDEVWSPLFERARNVRGLESYQFLWEDVLVPLARAMRPEIERAIDAQRPDVVVVDHQAIGGALAARRKGVRWASICTTSASVVAYLTDLPKVKAWADEKVRCLEEEAGLPPVAAPDLSPELVLVLSTEALVGPLDGFPAHYRFVGPATHDRRTAPEFPWDSLGPHPRVLVSLGTVSSERGDEFYATVVEAFADSPVRVVLVAPPERVPRVPANFIVRSYVPQLELLKHVDAVVSHAGHNTVCESLAQGLPMVLVPIRDDQPLVANQVVQAGAGIRLRFGRLTPQALRSAVDRVLAEPSFREAAGRVRESFARAGGAKAAARLLEELS